MSSQKRITCWQGTVTNLFKIKVWVSVCRFDIIQMFWCASPRWQAWHITWNRRNLYWGTTHIKDWSHLLSIRRTCQRMCGWRLVCPTLADVNAGDRMSSLKMSRPILLPRLWILNADFEGRSVSRQKLDIKPFVIIASLMEWYLVFYPQGIYSGNSGFDWNAAYTFFLHGLIPSHWHGTALL